MRIYIFKDVDDFIKSLPNTISSKILAHLKALELGYTESTVIKKLRGKIKELVVNDCRVVFFQIRDMTYVVDIFRKKSKKTPKEIISKAEKMYKEIANN